MGKKAQYKREQKLQASVERRNFLRHAELARSPWLTFWKRIDFWIYTLCFAALVAFPFLDPKAFADTAIIHTSMGDVEIEFYTKDAPKTVENIKLLTERGYYNGLTWHRVIKGFMIQTGDPNGDSTGGESAWGGNFADEINPASLGLTSDVIKKNEGQGFVYNSNLNSHKIDVGTVAMANRGPNTNASQFFIVTDKAQPELDGQYTVFAHVVKGMDVVKKISEVPTDESTDKPYQPVYVNSIELN